MDIQARVEIEIYSGPFERSDSDFLRASIETSYDDTIDGYGIVGWPKHGASPGLRRRAGWPEPGTYQGPEGAPSTKGLDPALLAKIQAKSEQWGIDPDVAVRVYRAEGAASTLHYMQQNASGAPAWGPYQFHFPGVGAEYEKATGYSVRDPSHMDDYLDFAFRYVRQHGWGAWAASSGSSGVTGMMGVHNMPAGQVPNKNVIYNDEVMKAAKKSQAHQAISPSGGPWVKTSTGTYATDENGNIQPNIKAPAEVPTVNDPQIATRTGDKKTPLSERQQKALDQTLKAMDAKGDEKKPTSPTMGPFEPVTSENLGQFLNAQHLKSEGTETVEPGTPVPPGYQEWDIQAPEKYDVINRATEKERTTGKKPIPGVDVPRTDELEWEYPKGIISRQGQRYEKEPQDVPGGEAI